MTCTKRFNLPDPPGQLSTTPRYCLGGFLGDVVRRRPIWITLGGEEFTSVRFLDNVNLQAMMNFVVAAPAKIKFLLMLDSDPDRVGYFGMRQKDLDVLDSYLQRLARLQPVLEHECKRRGVTWNTTQIPS